MYDIQQYCDEDGKCPFEEWFMGVESRAALKVRTAIARMETGNLGDVKSVGEGVSERRVDYGPGYRVYFGSDGRTKIILLIGGTKQRQQADIEAAKRYWKDYKNRRAKGA